MKIVLECFTKKYADFSGRASRKEFWLFVLIRVMPGNPNSPNPMQQKPYVVQRRNKEYFTLKGWVEGAAPETHVPLENFEFKGW